MISDAKKIDTEIRMRRLLDANDLPQPDSVEYGYACIRLFYEAAKVCVVIDIETPDQYAGE